MLLEVYRKELRPAWYEKLGVPEFIGSVQLSAILKVLNILFFKFNNNNNNNNNILKTLLNSSQIEN